MGLASFNRARLLAAEAERKAAEAEEILAAEQMKSAQAEVPAEEPEEEVEEKPNKPGKKK